MIVKEKRKIELELTQAESDIIREAINIVETMHDLLDRYGMLTDDGVNNTLISCSTQLHKVKALVASGIIVDNTGGTDE